MNNLADSVATKLVRKPTLLAHPVFPLTSKLPSEASTSLRATQRENRVFERGIENFEGCVCNIRSYSAGSKNYLAVLDTIAWWFTSELVSLSARKMSTRASIGKIQLIGCIMETRGFDATPISTTINLLLTFQDHKNCNHLGEIAMFHFQRELLNRTIVAASTAKMDGFEHTAAALLAIAKDLTVQFSIGTEGNFEAALKGVLTSGPEFGSRFTHS